MRAASPPAHPHALRIGSRVRHGTFGVGTVKGLEGAGEQQKMTVVSRSVGGEEAAAEVRRPRTGVNGDAVALLPPAPPS